MSQANDSRKCSQTGCKCPSTGCKSSSVGRISPLMGRKGKFIHRPRLEVNNCICLKGRMGAIDGVIKCFCEGDIKCEYCKKHENVKCIPCETASSMCTCLHYCTLKCPCYCHGNLKISVKKTEDSGDCQDYQDIKHINLIETILLNIKPINSSLPNYFQKYDTCSCGPFCDECECVCHNEKEDQVSCACSSICLQDCSCICHIKEEKEDQVSCACSSICLQDCYCICHSQVQFCTCNKECPIGCKCSINCKGGIYCFNSCLSSCSCKCHKQEKAMCDCSSLCDDKCNCGCHKSSSSFECETVCSCGCHLQCANKVEI